MTGQRLPLLQDHNQQHHPTAHPTLPRLLEQQAQLKEPPPLLLSLLSYALYITVYLLEPFSPGG